MRVGGRGQDGAGHEVGPKGLLKKIPDLGELRESRAQFSPSCVR